MLSAHASDALVMRHFAISLVIESERGRITSALAQRKSGRERTSGITALCSGDSQHILLVSSPHSPTNSNVIPDIKPLSTHTLSRCYIMTIPLT